MAIAKDDVSDQQLLGGGGLDLECLAASGQW
jgi:hypothetical protein